MIGRRCCEGADSRPAWHCESCGRELCAFHVAESPREASTGVRLARVCYPACDVLFSTYEEVRPRILEMR